MRVLADRLLSIQALFFGAMSGAIAAWHVNLICNRYALFAGCGNKRKDRFYLLNSMTIS